MALGGRELRLILSLQSYGSANWARVRRDIDQLERSIKAAKFNKLRIQEQIVRKAQQLTQARDRVSRLEQQALNRRTQLLSRAARVEQQFARQRIQSANNVLQIENAIATKQIQIKRQQDTIAKSRGLVPGALGVAANIRGPTGQFVQAGSIARSLAVQETNLATKRLGIQKQIADFGAVEASMSARVLNNKASLLARERALENIVGQRKAKELAIGKSLQGEGSRVKELTYRYRAALQTQQQLEILSKNLPRQAGILQSRLKGVLEQEKLIAAKKFEQAAAVARQIELQNLQVKQLDQLEARHAEVLKEIEGINRAEAAVNSELAAQLATLEKEAITLERAKISVGELAAEFKVLAGTQMESAVATDRAINRQNRLLRAQTAARTVGHLGRTAQFTGLLGVAGLGLVANQFATFDRATAKAATQLRGVGESFVASADSAGKLQRRILDMTRQFPASAKEMADSAYQIASGMNFAGNSTERLNKTTILLRAANRVAVAGQTDLASATDTVITAFNNFDPQAKNVNGILNRIFAIVRFGRGDFTQFASVFGRVAGAAHAAGASLTEAGGALAYLSQVLPRANATAGLARLYQILSRRELVAGFKALGLPITINVKGVEKLKPLSEIVREIVANSPKIRQGGIALSNLLAGVSARGQLALGARRASGLQGTAQARLVLTDLIKGYPQYRQVLRNVGKDNNEFVASLKRMRDTPGFKFQLALAQFKAFAVVLGQFVLPILARFLDHIVRAVHWFDNLSDHTKKLIAKIATFGAIGLLVGGTLAALIGSLATIGLMFTAAGATAVLAGAAFLAIGAAAIYIITHWKKVKAFFAGLTAFIASVWKDAMNTIIGLSEAAAAAVGEDFLNMVRVVTTAGSLIKDAFKHPLRNLHPIREFQRAGKSGIIKDLKDVLGISFLEKDARNRLSREGSKAAKAFNDAYYKGMHGGRTKIEDTAIAARLTRGAADLPKAKKHVDTFSTALAKQEKAFKNAAKAGSLLKYLQDFQNQSTANGVDKTQKLADATNRLSTARGRLTEATLRLQQAQQAVTQERLGVLGNVFQGPLMQGPLGQAFQGISQTLEGFGKVFPIPSKLILSDQMVQQNFFKQFARDIKVFRKAGAFKGTVGQQTLQEIFQMGASGALPFLEGLIKGHAVGKFAKNIEVQNKLIGRSDIWGKQLTAADKQLEAAKIQLDVARNRVAAAEVKDKTKGAHTTNYHGDTVYVMSNESNAEAIARYIRLHGGTKRHKGKKK